MCRGWRRDAFLRLPPTRLASNLQRERATLMNILLAFAPFLVFAAVSRFVGPTEGLIAGVLTSMGLLISDRLLSRRFKILDSGTFLLWIPRV
jgi:hypothetical protein